MSDDNGGPAFPVADPFLLEPKTVDESKRAAHGMTLRDYFAARAMQSYIARANYGAGNDQAARRIDSEYARAAYDMADAMLAARNA